MFVEGQEILEKRYKVIKKVGGGAFGEIFRGKSQIAPLQLYNLSLNYTPYMF